MSHRNSSEIKEEIASIEDRDRDRFENSQISGSDYIPDGEDEHRLLSLAEELELVEKIEEIEGMEDYGRGSPMDQFEDFLNEVCDEIHIGTLTYSPYTVLKAVDPIAFRETYWDWADGEVEALEDMIANIE